MVKKKPTSVKKKGVRGRTTHRIDRELLHAWLWKRRGRNNIIPLTQIEIAEILRFSIYTCNRMIAELIAAGKVTRNGNMYRVVDPKETRILENYD